MRVGLLSFNARVGDAIGNQVVEKLRFFLDRGDEVRVFVQSRRALHPQAARWTHLFSVPQPEGEQWEYLRSCDVVTAEYGQYYELLDLLPHLAAHGVRTLVDYHGVTPPQQWGDHNVENLRLGVARRGLLWCATAVLVHSRFTYRELRDQVGIPEDRLVLQGYPVDVDSAVVASTERKLRARLAIPDDAQLLLYVGRLAANKRVDVLIKGLHHLRLSGRKAHLAVVGDTGDVYQLQHETCLALADELGVGPFVHFVGPLVGDALWDAYRSADVFVTASEWESFCIPVIEAMAMGRPVVAARATALPEIVADAGLCFAPGDPAALAAAVDRILDDRSVAPAAGPARKIHIVDAWPGNANISGLTQSLASMARVLADGGKRVTYHALAESAGKLEDLRHLIRHDGVEIEVYDVEDYRPQQQQRLRARMGEDLSPQEERLFVESLPYSQVLMDRLTETVGEPDVVIAGPYLSHLTFAIARTFGRRTQLLPCWHDEPEARLSIWHEAYDGVGGYLYHSAEEQLFAEAELGFNHPNSRLIGAVRHVAVRTQVDPVVKKHRTLVYCGRFSEEKNLPLLLEYAERYSSEHPGRFQFLFAGEGSVPVPNRPWARNLGVVSEECREKLYSAADALITLSVRESLCLTALDAWQVGTPVIGHRDCDVLSDFVAESKGGAVIHDYASFAQVLDDVWHNPEKWRRFGLNGQAFVRGQYQDADRFRRILEEAVEQSFLPLRSLAVAKGHERAKRFSREAWRAALDQSVRDLLRQQVQPIDAVLEVRRRLPEKHVGIDVETVDVPVVVFNWGASPANLHPGDRWVICSQPFEESSGDAAAPVARTALAKPLHPGQDMAAVAAVNVPERAGTYIIRLWAMRAEAKSTIPGDDGVTSEMRLVVTPDSVDEGTCSALLAHARLDLEDADQLQRLPDDYIDVTQGALAKIKRSIKQKLLNNFKVAYVDVLSRRQSAFNRQVLSILEELYRCCELLDHAVTELRRRDRRRRRRRKKRPLE